MTGVQTCALPIYGVEIAVAVPPQIRITQFSLNPENGIGVMTFTSEPGATYSVMATSELRTPDTTIWTEIVVNINSGGQTTTQDFIDFDMPARFYRVVKVP